MAKTFVGTVSSSAADKTIVVTVNTSKTHPLYHKQYTVSKKFMAHDEKNEAGVGDQVVIRISDTGIGISPELLPKLFEPFVTHGKAHGTGLGLAIAKSVVNAHTGKISVSSVHGHGTTVDIRLPAPPAPL